ncbi:MAG TPA: recombinase family protein [Clostridia bacterium]
MSVIEKIRAKKRIVRAVAYTRFSSDNQREESIDAQLRAIKEYAKRNDIVIVGEYIDKAKSAMTDNRPEFLRMIADSKKEEFDIVLVHKLDRFARNRQDSIGYRMELKRHGVSLISVLEYLDDDSPESLILESVLEAMAEYYSRNLAREVNKGMRENALKGIHTGGLPPLGYDVDQQTKKLIINEREAAAVRLIFKMFIEGYGYDKIINELNLQGFKAKSGNHFGHNSLHNIIRNEKYTGVYIFNKLASKDMDGKRNGNAYKEPEEIIRVEGAVPAIISKEEFEIAQNVIITRKQVRAANNAVEVYLLSGKIFCGECEGAYVGNRKFAGRNKTLQVTYRCSTRKSKHICKNKDVRKDYIEAFVLERLADYVFNTILIPKLINEYSRFEMEKDSITIKKQASLKKRLAEIKKEISNLLVLASKVASESLVQKLEELEKEKNILQDQLEEVNDKVNSNKISEEEFSEIFNKAYDYIRDGCLSTTKSLVEIFVERVLVYETHIKVMFKYHPELNNSSISACL